MSKSPNWKNRTLFHGDNLEVMRGMNSRTVDLIATDPPFNKGKNFETSTGKFNDTWKLGKESQKDLAKLRKKAPIIAAYLESVQQIQGDAMTSYLLFMAFRLREMRRILKPTGSLFLHCDYSASHCLRILLDSIFGREQFRNEIVWCYTGPSTAVKAFPKKHDNILFYAKSHKSFFDLDPVRIPYKSLGLRKAWRFKDSYTEDLEKYRKKGKSPESYWVEDLDDMSPVGRLPNERKGYPTQKPCSLYERIIKCASKEGDLVFDPFAGSGTTLMAADKLNRKWVGVEIGDCSTAQKRFSGLFNRLHLSTEFPKR